MSDYKTPSQILHSINFTISYKFRNKTQFNKHNTIYLDY